METRRRRPNLLVIYIFYSTEAVSLSTTQQLSIVTCYTGYLSIVAYTAPSYTCMLPWRILTLYWIKGAMAFVCFSFFFFWLHVLDEYSAFESTLNSSIVSYRWMSVSEVLTSLFCGPWRFHGPADVSSKYHVPKLEMHCRWTYEPLRVF